MNFWHHSAAGITLVMIRDTLWTMVRGTLAWMKHPGSKTVTKFNFNSYCIKLVLTCCMKMLHIKLWFHHSNISGVGNCSIAIRNISKIFMDRLNSEVFSIIESESYLISWKIVKIVQFLEITKIVMFYWWLNISVSRNL